VNEYHFKYKEHFLERRWFEQVYMPGDVREIETFIVAETLEEAKRKLDDDNGIEILDLELVGVYAKGDPRSPRGMIGYCLKKELDSET
jgi:hypothetical protein